MLSYMEQFGLDVWDIFFWCKSIFKFCADIFSSFSENLIKEKKDIFINV